MIANSVRRRLRAAKRWLRKKRPALLLSIVVLIAGMFIYTGYMNDRRLTVDPATYAPLLHVIARAESNNNDNAYFGNAGNTSIVFTRMSIAEVLAWQANHINKGNISSAVGKYQIINTTLSGLVKQLGIDTNNKFDAAMQDRLAIALLERRGSESYINKELSRDEFAANLAKEWAGLPKVTGDNPNDSYYAADGINKSNVSVADVQKAIEPIAPQK